MISLEDIKSTFGSLTEKIRQNPIFHRIVEDTFIFSIMFSLFFIISYGYSKIGVLGVASIIFILYLLLNLSIAVKKIRYGTKIVEKNPSVLEELDISFPVDLYVYYTEEYTDNQARYCPVNDRIEINSDVLRRYKKGRVGKEKLEALLVHELGHYKRKYIDFALKFTSNIVFFIFSFIIIWMISNIIIGSIILSVLVKGFHFLDLAIGRHKEKKADQTAYNEGHIKGLIDMWGYENSQNKIKIDYTDIIYNQYPTLSERHIWIMQFEGKI